MGRGLKRPTWQFALKLAAALTAVLAQGSAQAQAPGMIPGMGGMTSATSQPINYGAIPGQAPVSSIPDYDSNVSFIDSAIPMTQVKLRFDANFNDHRPTRAEYLFPKSGTPGSPGWWLPERNVDHQELCSYIEVAIPGTFSGFLELPTRWVNPEVNPNDWGMADIQGGLKLAVVNSPGFCTTLEVRGTFPSRSGPGTSVSHYSVEPGLLVYLRPAEWLTIEGEARYYMPLNGTDFAGEMARYGLGVSFGQRSNSAEWITPVLEFIGWSVLDGKEMVVMPGGPSVRSAVGDTIVNGIAGVRLGMGEKADMYVGYGRSLTGASWQDQFWRLEFRVRF